MRVDHFPAVLLVWQARGLHPVLRGWVDWSLPRTTTESLAGEAALALRAFALPAFALSGFALPAASDARQPP